jgi:hypothetical protein
VQRTARHLNLVDAEPVPLLDRVEDRERHVHHLDADAVAGHDGNAQAVVGSHQRCPKAS